MDPHAILEALYDEHADAVRAFAYRRTDAATAEDVVGDVFVVAWRRIKDVPPNARTWLLGVAHKALANQRRANARQVALLQRLAAEPHHVGIEDEAAIDSAVLRALSELRPGDREVLLLTAWDGLTPRQAAQVLGIRPAALSMRTSRARERLRAKVTAAEAPTKTTRMQSKGTSDAV